MIQVISARPLKLASQLVKGGDYPAVPKYDDGAHVILRHPLRFPLGRIYSSFEYIH